jgi:hypothetical protein
MHNTFSDVSYTFTYIRTLHTCSYIPWKHKILTSAPDPVDFRLPDPKSLLFVQIRTRILQSISKILRNIMEVYRYLTFLFLASWKPLKKRLGSGSVVQWFGFADPESVPVTLRNRNTACFLGILGSYKKGKMVFSSTCAPQPSMKAQTLTHNTCTVHIYYLPVILFNTKYSALVECK